MGRTPLGDGQNEVGTGRRGDRVLHLREDVGSWVLCTRDLRGRVLPRLARRSQYWNRTRDSPRLRVLPVFPGCVALFDLVALLVLLFSARERELQFHKTARNIHRNWH